MISYKRKKAFIGDNGVIGGSRKGGEDVLSTIEINKEKSLFQVFFLKENKDQSVEVKEIEEIDFREIENRLKQKESVFITYKRKQKLKTGVISREDTSDPWYFTHI